MPSSPIPAARCHYLLDLLAQVPDTRKRRGRRHALAGLLAAGIAAVIAGSRSFAAIGQWAADAGPDVLAALGADRALAPFRRPLHPYSRVAVAFVPIRTRASGARAVQVVQGLFSGARAR